MIYWSHKKTFPYTILWGRYSCVILGKHAACQTISATISPNLLPPLFCLQSSSFLHHFPSVWSKQIYVRFRQMVQWESIQLTKSLICIHRLNLCHLKYYSLANIKSKLSFEIFILDIQIEQWKYPASNCFQMTKKIRIQEGCNVKQPLKYHYLYL